MSICHHTHGGDLIGVLARILLDDGLRFLLDSSFWRCIVDLSSMRIFVVHTCKRSCLEDVCATYLSGTTYRTRVQINNAGRRRRRFLVVFRHGGGMWWVILRGKSR